MHYFLTFFITYLVAVILLCFEVSSDVSTSCLLWFVFVELKEFVFSANVFTGLAQSSFSFSVDCFKFNDLFWWFVDKISAFDSNWGQLGSTAGALSIIDTSSKSGRWSIVEADSIFGEIWISSFCAFSTSLSCDKIWDRRFNLFRLAIWNLEAGWKRNWSAKCPSWSTCFWNVVGFSIFGWLGQSDFLVVLFFIGVICPEWWLPHWTMLLNSLTLESSSNIFRLGVVTCVLHGLQSW